MSPDLFSSDESPCSPVEAAPLAERMRPRSLSEVVGQKALLSQGRFLRQVIDQDQVPSLIFWGPPGVGKTTIARVISGATGAHFVALSAVLSGVKEVKQVLKEAEYQRRAFSRPTILFVDELHRFNKAQQDVILPHVEDGTLIFIGATTENPSFEVISPLLSRATVFTLNPLSDSQVKEIVSRALTDEERGVGLANARMDDEVIEVLVSAANGDARNVLNSLELAVAATDPDEQGVRIITKSIIEDATQKRAQVYDKAGDRHYDTISAFIKSVRGSDPDAAIYWLARMIEAGEDPLFIARRLVILAAEDIGMADPQALPIAVAAQQAVHFVGMPEGRILLAQATVYLSTAYKSNSAYVAIGEAMDEVREGRNDPVPMHLRNAATGLMREMGYGKDYRYAHDYDGSFVQMENLPHRLRGRCYYHPKDNGYEVEVAQRLKRWWRNMSEKDVQ